MSPKHKAPILRLLLPPGFCVLMLLASCRATTTEPISLASAMPAPTSQHNVRVASSVPPTSPAVSGTLAGSTSTPAPSATPGVPAATGSALQPGERYARAGTFVDRITSGSRLRKFRVHIPPGYSPQEPAVLVLAFHAALSEARDLELQTGLSDKADQAGYVVVYPQALPASRSAAGGPGRWDTRLSAGNPDEQFIRDLIDYLPHQLSMDASRIYATGFSNGATFVDLLACTMPDRLAAVASMSGGYADPETACRPGRRVPVLFVYGTADVGIRAGDSGWSPAWVQRYHCELEPARVDDRPVFRETVWRGCDGGAEVWALAIKGGGHTWFSEPVDATEVLWAFFEAHRLP